MDWQSLEEAGAVHPDPHSDNILLQRMGQRVWTDLGSSQSMLVTKTKRLHVFCFGTLGVLKACHSAALPKRSQIQSVGKGGFQP